MLKALINSNIWTSCSKYTHKKQVYEVNPNAINYVTPKTIGI